MECYVIAKQKIEDTVHFYCECPQLAVGQPKLPGPAPDTSIHILHLQH